MCPLPCLQLHNRDPRIQKHSESFCPLSAFLYRSEPNRSLTFCPGEPFGIPVQIDHHYMQKCRKEMPMEKDYMAVIISCIAEITASDVTNRLKQLRLGAVESLRRYLCHYRQLGYIPKLLYAIADKKCRMIASITTKSEMEKLIRPNCPHYNGSGFVPDAYSDSVPEEELICWSETSLKGPLNAAGFQRYMELFKQILPEESRRLSL